MTRVSRLSPFVTALVFSFCALWIVAPPVMAQTTAEVTDGVNPETIATDPPAHVSFVDGAAVLERDGQPDAAPVNMPLLAGDRLRTQGGRVEILFGDGSTLHLDANTTLDFQSDELVRLLDGRIRLSIPGPTRRVSYRIDASSASALISQSGEYRLAVLHGAREAEIELAVIRGAAELVNDDGRTPLRAGERAYARANAAPSYAYVFNSASWDSFDRWSEGRRDQRFGVSTQYLPDEVRPYAPSFDRYGAWGYDAAYGNVWYPRVSVDWRPYYNGRWVTLRPYGWTWVGADPWAWATHHYGRWGMSAGAWFWIPGRSWGPAWVSWAYAPGYVSWCPLGWNNRPVLQIVNVYGGFDPWRAWTAVPRRHFGVDYVNVHYVAGRTFDARTRGSFVPRYSAPETRGYAVPRSSAPIRVAGTARPRGSSSPVYTNLEPGASRVGPGGQRVIVGPPRSAVVESAPGRAERAPNAARGAPLDRGDRSGVDARDSGDRGQRGPTAAMPSPNIEREPGLGRRAVPREDPTYGVPAPSRTFGSGSERTAPAAPRGADSVAPGYRDTPYGRRAPDRPESGTSARPEYRPYGTAVPRAPEAVRPPAPTYGGAPRTSPESARPAAPESRPSGGMERRAPANDRPSGPPQESPRAVPRSSPGAERNSPPPDNRGGPPPSQGHSRSGGQPSGGGRRGGR
jgi:uncharacterized protein DUF6600/FecR-like protein